MWCYASEICVALQISLFGIVFSSYYCVPLPQPVDSEEQSQWVESMEFGQLKGEFLEEYYILEVRL